MKHKCRSSRRDSSAHPMLNMRRRNRTGRRASCLTLAATKWTSPSQHSHCHTTLHLNACYQRSSGVGHRQQWKSSFRIGVTAIWCSRESQKSTATSAAASLRSVGKSCFKGFLLSWKLPCRMTQVSQEESMWEKVWLHAQTRGSSGCSHGLADGSHTCPKSFIAFPSTKTLHKKCFANYFHFQIYNYTCITTLKTITPVSYGTKATITIT